MGFEAIPGGEEGSSVTLLGGGLRNRAYKPTMRFLKPAWEKNQDLFLRDTVRKCIRLPSAMSWPARWTMGASHHVAVLCYGV